MSAPQESKEPRREGRSRLEALAWPLCSLAIAAILCATALIAVSKISAAARDASGGVANAVKSVFNRDVSMEFASYAQSLEGKAQLVLCKERRLEIVNETIPSGIPLLEGSAELTLLAPVEYNYFVDMKGKWTLEERGGTLQVTAPALDVLTPAIDFAKTREIVRKSPFVFGEDKAMADLKARLSARLKTRAMNGDNVKEAREAARLELGGFVAAWLLSKERNEGIASILVKFADEPDYPKLGLAPQRREGGAK